MYNDGVKQKASISRVKTMSEMGDGMIAPDMRRASGKEDSGLFYASTADKSGLTALKPRSCMACGSLTVHMTSLLGTARRCKRAQDGGRDFGC